MKQLYFVQVNDTYYNNGHKNTYIPYAAGCIEAYCMQSVVIAGEYSFGKIVYARSEIGKIVSGLHDPYMVLFSCSVWNTQFHLALAEAVKAAYPACFITFGGHQVPSDGSFLKKYPFIDFLIHFAGEEPVQALLESLSKGISLDGVPNLSFRDESGNIVTTDFIPQTGTNYPSPYLLGVFDDLLADDMEFSVLIETNRGCPNSCAYCDWGALNCDVRLFPLERVFAEIDWVVAHKIDYIYCTDANFCLFSRDEQIVDYIVKCNKTSGYPKFFHVNFTKNRPSFVYEISAKLVGSGLSKAQTIAFQSLNPEVLRNIGRKNISTDSFRSLMKRFFNNKITSYSELILGLPGETCESFCDGICSLIENGQHHAINVYPCELLPNSAMGRESYRKRYQIESTRVPFRMMHSTLAQNEEEITEFAEYITSTYSMNKNEWANALLFSSYIQGMHNLGLLRAVAIYCRYEMELSYLDFYRSLILYSEAHRDLFLHRVYKKIISLCRGVIEGTNEFVALCENTENILWGFDELVFLETYKALERFYTEIGGWLERQFGISSAMRALLTYQYDIIKKIGKRSVEIKSDYDFYNFLQHVYDNDPLPLQKKRIVLQIEDPAPVYSFSDFARQCVWHGRNKRETDYTSSCYSVQTEPD